MLQGTGVYFAVGQYLCTGQPPTRSSARHDLIQVHWSGGSDHHHSLPIGCTV